jgi:hypothetical protein
MADLANCPNCGKLYVKNPMRDVCDDCYKKEEAAFDRVFAFLRKRENRAATVETIVAKNDVTKELVYKWVRKAACWSPTSPISLIHVTAAVH